MTESTGRTTVDELAHELSYKQASNEQARLGESNDMRRDIRAAMNRHGLESKDDARPSALKHIVGMHECGEITARHVGNDMPPNDTNAVEAHPDKYWLSREDTEKVRRILLPDERPHGRRVDHTVESDDIASAPPTHLVPASDVAGTAAGKGMGKKSKLTDEQREQIRLRAGQGDPHQKLADEFGVSRQYVGKLCAGDRKKGASPFPGVATNYS